MAKRVEARGTSALRRFLPLAIPRRSDAALFFQFDVSAGPSQRLVEEESTRSKPLTLFHIVLAAALRTFVERPKLNRTVIGGRIFERDTLALTFSVKKGKRDGSRIVSTKVVFEPTDTLFDVQEKVNRAVAHARDPNLQTTAEKEMEFAHRLPRTVVRGALRVLQRADRLQLLPERFVKGDPTRTSAFFANLGSIGLDASFHHLSDLGTASIHGTIGAVKPTVVVGDDGEPTVEDAYTLRLAIDDRIVDGFYCARSLVRFQHWLTHPVALAQPWPTREDLPVSMLWKWAREDPERPAYWLRSSTEDDWFPTHYGALWVEVRNVARAFIELGVKPADTVCIQGSNRPEWSVSYLAAQAIGAIPCGLHEDLHPAALTRALQVVQPRLVVLENEGPWNTVQATVPHGIWVTMQRESSEAMDWNALNELGAANDDGEVERRLGDIKGSDPGVAVFTSGSSGEPKAALLSHDSLRWTVDTALDVLGVRADERTISYLPLSHIAEQNFTILGAICKGTSVAYAPSRGGIRDTLMEVRPTVFFGVPQIWERLKRDGDGTLPSMGLDRVRLAISGAGALHPDVFRWFEERGLSLLQTYGQTEGCGPTTLTRPGEARAGTCGTPLPGVDVEVGPDGCIRFRGRNRFIGYRHGDVAPEWVETGDIGRWSEGHLEILGRRKAMIVPLTGENVAPEPLEQALEGQRLVARAVVIGDDRPHLAALLTLDPEAVVGYLASRGVGPTALLNQNPLVLEAMSLAVERVNRSVSRSQQIRSFAVLPGALSPEHGELTPTLKLRRSAIEKRWSARIEAMYRGESSWSAPTPSKTTGFKASPMPRSQWRPLFELRHSVFDDAGHLTPGFYEDGRLWDGFDDDAVQFGMTDPDGALAGTARLVRATGPMPVESLFHFEPVDLPRSCLGEVGRLSIARRWRMRRAPVVTLIQATLDYALAEGITHAYAFVPARSVRLYAALGLPVWEVPMLPPQPRHVDARAGMAPYFANQDPRVVCFAHPGAC